MRFFTLKKSILQSQSLIHKTGITIPRLYSTVGETILKDFKEIYLTGKAPQSFNFSKDVFDKHAATRPSALALWFDNDQNFERKWTFSELQTESIRSAIFLRNHLDLPNSVKIPSKSPYILTVLPRVPEWWFLHLAAIRIAAKFSPGTTMLSSQDIQHRLESSEARMIITDEENMHKVDEASARISPNTNLKKIVVSKSSEKVSNLPKGWIDYKECVDEIQDGDILSFKNSNTKSEDVAQAYFTSGTTGKPKMVAHTHASYGIGHYTTTKMLGLKETDVHLNISDPGWAKSSYSNFFAPWTAGSTVYIHQMERFEAKKVLKVLTEKPITTFCGPPTLYKSMVQEPDDALFKFKSLRYSVGAGEPVSPEVARVWKNRTGIKLHQLYGQTELCCVDCQESEKDDSIGIPNGLYDLRIIDDKGNECPPGIEGQISLKVKPLRPVGVFKGYLKGGPEGPEMDTEKNASVFVGDYYLTGDQGLKDESGHIFYLGRNDDVISSAGYRIGPSEIESVLQTHPAVVESAAVASPDPQRGEVVKAFIVLTQTYKNSDKQQLQKEIQDYVKLKTASYKYPRKVEFVDNLPKTVSGKILRRELKRQEFNK